MLSAKISENNWSNEGFKRYTKNTGYLFLEKIVRMLVVIFVWASMARYLGAEKFGIFSFSLSFIYLFGIAADLGLEHIVIRDLVKGIYKRSQVVGTAFILKLLGATLAIVLILVLSNCLSIDTYTKLIVSILSLQLFFRSFDAIDFYFQSRVLSKYAVYSQIGGSLVTTVLCLSFIYLKLPLQYFACAVVVEAVVTSLGLSIFYIKKHQKVSSWHFDINIGRNLLGDAWPMILSGFAIAIYMRIDQIMIKEMLGASAVGYYAAAARISEAFYFIPTAITTSLFPAIVNARKNDPLKYKNRIRVLFSILFWSAMTIAIVGSLAAEPIIKILYGETFSAAAAVLSIHVWANVSVFLGEVRHKWAVNENLQIFTMFYLILAAFLNVGLNLILIPVLKIQGAAIATVAAQFTANVLCNLFHEKTKPIFLVQVQAVNLVGALKNFKLSG